MGGLNEGIAGWLLLGGLLGAVAGSFLATLVLRWPQGRRISAGRSQCDGCGRTLAAAELVPLVGYLLLRGRCRSCGSRIHPFHPAVEAASVVLGIAAAWIAPGPAGLAWALLLWMLLVLALLDARHFWLPDALTLPLAGLGFAASVVIQAPAPAERALGAAAGYLVFRSIAAAYRRLRGREGLGAGDAKLMAALGAWLGWRALPPVLLGACLIGFGWIVVRLLSGRAVTADHRLPLGTLLAASGGAFALLLAARAPDSP